MMIHRKTTTALTALAISLATLGTARAATTPAATPPAKAMHPHRHHAAHQRAVSSEQRLHDRVVHTRAMQQRRWIASELHHHRLIPAQAATLRDAVAAIERDQHALHAQGSESVTTALAVSHKQDILDWAIRERRVDFEPRAIAALDAQA